MGASEVPVDGSKAVWVGNGTVISGFPNKDILAPKYTSGELSEYSTKVEFIGSEFGVAPEDKPMPSSIYLVNEGFLCPHNSSSKSGLLNPDYECGAPVWVSPSEYPDSNGLPVNKTVVASWQVVCNITKLKGSNPKCCVSFTAYNNESAIPCKTCACGCPTSSSQTCSATSPALLLPPQALLLPFENRSDFAKAWADIKHLSKPNRMPCGDNCGVSIHWHLLSDYRRGWTSKVTIFNWDETPFADWFAAVEMGDATLGFEKAYSFNGTAFINGKGDKNNTIFMQGLPGLNYIVAESDDVKDPLRNPRVPGKQQSVLSFTKKNMQYMDVAGYGFPKKVYFNGEECSLPDELPSSGGYRKGGSVFLIIALFTCSLFSLFTDM